MATTDDNPTAESLARRPEARAFKIEDLLAEVRSGRMRIPSFQRGLRWEREDARKLMDSLYRGYPVGTLLFWETKAEPGEMRFGSFAVSGAGRSDALWVVDGQQRIVSLARVLLAAESDADEFALYFDLDEGEFAAPPPPAKRGEDPARWLPMTAVLDSENLMNWAYKQVPGDEERRRRAFQVGKRVREYEIPAYVVRTDNEDTLREIFSRINSSGKPLDAFQVFDALHGARSQTRPATIPQIVSELTKHDFGRLEEKILYRLLRVLQGADVSERGQPLRLINDGLAETAYRETAQSAALAIQFLKHDVGIPHYELLPYKQPLVILGKFFHHHPSPQPRSRDLLARWLWRGVLNGKHMGDNVSTRAALKCIKPDNEQESVQRLLKMVEERPATTPDVTAKFNFRHSMGKLLVLALLDLRPRDLETGILLHPTAFMGNGQTDRALPSLIPPFAKNHNNLVQSVANRLAHPSRPGLRKILLNVTDLDIPDSHGITETAMHALCFKDSARFLSLRADYLRELFQDFFERHARWDEPDRPSIASLLVADEED